MATNEKTTDTTPTALQSTSIAVTRPKWIIGGAVIIVLIVILLEIYAPRSKTAAPDKDIQQDSATNPVAIEPLEGGVADELH